MQKSVINVPRGIRYISDWEGYKLADYPFPHILNKKITGCGFTEYCLRNEQDTILCSPRRILLENKESQHPGEIFYFRNDLEIVLDYDKDLQQAEKSQKRTKSETEIHEAYLKYQDDVKLKLAILRTELLNYIQKKRMSGKPVKIIVTYDSFKFIREILGDLSDYQVVIDEFQSIFTDSRFKSGTEIRFLSVIKGLTRICFLSATPMLEKYLNMLDEFKDLPYIEFDWETEDPGRVIKPNLEVHSCSSLIEKASEIIEKYIAGNFEKYIFNDEDNPEIIRTIESREAVFYFNSVKEICYLIKKYGLTPDNTNVLCAITEDNIKRVKKAFRANKEIKRVKSDSFGIVPKLGEPHKMFTFCTRTVYLGADFYSTCARSFIFSNANIECLAVDISLDLPQILGRQRLKENPWKNSAELYFKSRSKLVISEQEFKEFIDSKISMTQVYLASCSEMEDKITSNQYQKLVKRLWAQNSTKNYSDDYYSFNIDENGNVYPVFNNLVMISELRAFDVQQVDYKNRFTVFNAISKNRNLEYSEVDQLLTEFEKLPYFHQKMQFVCKKVSELSEENANVFLNQIPMKFKNYYTTLGPEICSAKKYQIGNLEEEYKRRIYMQSENLRKELYSKFTVGCQYSTTEIKNKLSEVYESNGIQKLAMAKDLKSFFELKPCQFRITDKNGNNVKVNGFKIISKKR